MNYRYTGNEFHEIAGVMFSAMVLFHNAINWRWYVALFRGGQTFRRALATAVNLLLVLLLIALFVTGALISVTVFALLDIQSAGLAAHDLHQGAAYAVFILTAIHLGLRWDVFMVKLKRCAYAVGLGWSARANRLGVIAVALYGVYAFFAHRIGEKLLIRHVFAWGEAPSFWGFMLDYCAMMGCCIAATYHLIKTKR